VWLPVIRFVLYGIFGWCAEIIWTASTGAAQALAARRRIDRRLLGYTFLWMFPIYGGGGLLFELVHARVAGWPWPARGVTYMLGCFAVEYAAGWSLNRGTGTIPWDYSHARWNVQGLIRLDYAPVWFGFGLLLESVEQLVRGVEPALWAVLPLLRLCGA
jgi:uncharacterized membrane protein